MISTPFGKACFRPNMKTVCLRVHIFSRILSFLYYTFSLHWHLSLKSPFPAVVLLVAGQVTETAPAGSLQLQHGWMWTLHTLTLREHVLSTSTLLISQATCFEIVVCGPKYIGKQLECLGELESNEAHPVSCQHIPSSPLSETDSYCGCIKEIPHKHLISQEHYLKTKSLRIGLYCREQCLLQMCLHLAEYIGTQFPLHSLWGTGVKQ